MSDDTPTERFESPTAPAPSADKAPRSKRLILILAIIGGLLLIAVVVLLTLIFSGALRGSSPTASSSPESTETATPTPTPTPSVTVSPTPSTNPSASAKPSTPPSASAPPPTTGPVFTSFSPANNSSAGCTNNSDPVSVTFTWTSTGATEAAIGVATSDAFTGAYATGLPASGSYDLNYQCNNESEIYTVSIRGTSGQTNKTITLKR